MPEDMSRRKDISRVMYRSGRCLSFILINRLPDDSSSLPPDNGRATLNCRYIWPCNPWDVRPFPSPGKPVGYYPAFSPLPFWAVVFCHIVPDVAAGFPLGNMVPFVARTFLTSFRGATSLSSPFDLCFVAQIRPL